MNWLEIDKILYGIIERHDSQDGVIDEVRKHFKWTQSQAEAAVIPLLKRHTNLESNQETPKKQSKRMTSKRKKL